MGGKTNHKPIIITGFPYAFPYYFKVFDFLADKDDFIFVLPKFWFAKRGKIQLPLEKKPNFKIYGLKAFSYGRESLLGGIFKGWMPGILFLLPYLKIEYKSKVLYSCSEPNLLTTLCNGLIAKILGFKHILFTWQNVPSEARLRGLKLKLSNCLVHFNLWLADGIICGNNKAQNIVRNFNSRIRTLICPLSGVDIERFRPGIVSNWREKPGIKPEEKLILFYGTLDARKGIEILIKAFSILTHNPRPKTCNLTIVGTGPKKDELTKLADELGVSDRIVFLDWMKNDELPALLNSADIFVYPSIPSGGWEEQFGYAMAEASACGVPVVATQTGSIGEVIKDGQSGILVKPNDPDQLAGAISKILSDDNLRRQMGEHGRKYIMENFSHQVVANKLSNFLHSFIIDAF